MMTTRKTVKEILIDLLKENGMYEERMPLRQIIDDGRTLFFNFDYPLWTDSLEVQKTYGDFRPTFEKMFLKFFFNNKICYDDYEMWNLELDSSLNLIMPYYNQLLESETWFKKYIKNPAENTDYTEEYTRNIESENDGYSENNSSNELKNTQEDTGSLTNKTKGQVQSKTGSIDKTTSDQDSQSSNKSVSGTEGVNNLLPKSAIDPSIDYATDKSTNKVVGESKGMNGTISDTLSENNSSQTSSNDSENTSENENYSENETNAEATGSSQFNNTGNSEEKYTFRRHGNIGVQTPGEVFTQTRKAFINTTKDIFEDSEIKNLFIRIY